MWITPSSEKPFPTLRPPHTHTQAPGTRGLSGCGLFNPVSILSRSLHVPWGTFASFKGPRFPEGGAGVCTCP